MKIHERIKVIYELLGLNASQFAESIEIKGQTISRMAQQEGKPSFDFLQKMFVKYPEVNERWIFTEEDNPLKNITKEDYKKHLELNEPRLVYGEKGEKTDEKRLESLEDRVSMIETTLKLITKN
jgi:transcriptional regulator with XRE-family HTH domain